jgi:hypothetical protein
MGEAAHAGPGLAIAYRIFQALQWNRGTLDSPERQNSDRRVAHLRNPRATFLCHDEVRAESCHWRCRLRGRMPLPDSGTLVNGAHLVHTIS